MSSLALLLILVVAGGAFAAAPRFRAFLKWTAIAGTVVAAFGLYLMFWAPRDYMVRFPGTATLLHPWLAALYAGLGIILAAGILFGLLVRSSIDRWRR